MAVATRVFLTFKAIAAAALFAALFGASQFSWIVAGLETLAKG